MVKNYMIIRTTGKALYSTKVWCYKLVNNTPILLGELRGQPEDYAIRYLSDVLHRNGSKIKALELYQAGKINIHEICM